MNWFPRRRPATRYEGITIVLALPIGGAVVAYEFVLANPGYLASTGPLVIAFNALFLTVSVPILLAAVTGVSLL